MLCHSKHLVFYSKESCFLKRDFVLCWLAADYTLMCLGRFYVNTSSTKLIVNRSDNCNKEKLNVNVLFYDSAVMKMKYSKITWMEENTTN